MPLSRDIRTYPQWCMEIVMKFSQGVRRAIMDTPSESQATRSRQQFYMFRTLLEEPQLRAAANAIMIKIVRGTRLEFIHVDLEAPALHFDPVVEAPDLQQKEENQADPLEEATERWLRK